MRPEASALVEAVRAKLAASRAQVDLLVGTELHGTTVARALLKEASAREVTKPLGSYIAKGVGLAGKGLHHVGEAGAGLLEGLGAGQEAQNIARRGVQLGALGAAGTAAARSTRAGRQKIDEFRYRHGLYRGA